MVSPGASHDEATANVLSIEAVPRHLLPDGQAREALCTLAAAGHDVYAYASGGPTHGIWCAWLGPLADVRADRNGRVPIAEWCERWRELLDEAGFSQEVRP